MQLISSYVFNFKFAPHLQNIFSWEHIWVTASLIIRWEMIQGPCKKSLQEKVRTRLWINHVSVLKNVSLITFTNPLTIPAKRSNLDITRSDLVMSKLDLFARIVNGFVNGMRETFFKTLTWFSHSSVRAFSCKLFLYTYL